jgi:hypothetical protein
MSSKTWLTFAETLLKAPLTGPSRKPGRMDRTVLTPSTMSFHAS